MRIRLTSTLTALLLIGLCVLFALVACDAPSTPIYPDCDAVRSAGAAPIHAADPGFESKFDRDHNGVGCED